jgi:YbgC/YbaW family acyl-CoA thioester hydrolase
MAVIRVRVPFVDVDSSMRIHFTAMFRYLELAEHELMRTLGTPYGSSSLFADLAMPRVHLSCDFMGAVVFEDQLEVEARVEKVGTSSWTVAFTARKVARSNGQPLEREEAVAQGRMVIVAMDPATQRATPLPEALRRALTGQ